jgi:ferric-dicitrate binding protein FerR (iron transport regulator)
MTWLVNRPAIQVPAEELAARISAAGNQARKQDHETVLEAARALSQATGKIDGLVSRARHANLQRQRLWRVGICAVAGGTVAGMLLTVGLQHVAPEHSAAWMLGLNGCRSANHRMAIK